MRDTFRCVGITEVIKGDLVVFVLLYEAEFGTFITGEAYVVFLFDLFNSFPVCAIDVLPFLLGL